MIGKETKRPDSNPFPNERLRTRPSERPGVVSQPHAARRFVTRRPGSIGVATEASKFDEKSGPPAGSNRNDAGSSIGRSYKSSGRYVKRGVVVASSARTAQGGCPEGTSWYVTRR